MAEKIKLTSEQEQKLIDSWNATPLNPPGLKDMINLIFPGFDGRSIQGLAVKESLSKMNIKARTSNEPESKVDKIILSDNDKEFIVSNSSTMSALEIAKEIFKNPSLTNLNAEARAISQFRKTLDTTVIFNQHADKQIPEGNYIPPNTLDKVLKKVNQYVNCALNKEGLKPQQKKNLDTLITYLHTYRFIKQMNAFSKEDDRNLCEDAFIRSTYDKPDLQQEEVDQYIEYSTQVVQGFTTLSIKELLQRSLEENTQANIDNPEEQRKARMDLVEALGKASTEYHQCMKRQETLINDLKVKRSKRLDGQIAESASILTLVQLWKFEETRTDYLKTAEHEQTIVANEVERLTSVAEIKAKIMGLDKDGIMNG